ncbi:hypothetical protein ACFL3M_03265, partial [Patescibacteria group bacterium]
VIISVIFWLISKRKTKDASEKNISFSRNQIILIIATLFLTIFIKTAYLENTVFPTSTDLGHHMYWSRLIINTEQLPVYEKVKLTQEAGIYALEDPESIADFIIGEHLIFSAIGMISKIDVISYFPTLLLHLFNIMGILGVFIFILRVFDKSIAKNAAITSLILLGPLYAISSPQSKYISGGVIGNTLGNLLIPLSLYFLFRALKEKNSKMLMMTIFTVMGLAYTHHLSTFIFAFIFIFIFALFNISLTYQSLLETKKEKLKNLFCNYKKIALEWINLLFSKPVLGIIAFTVLFYSTVYIPAYIKTSAVDTAVGAPSKATRAGLSVTELKFSTGEPRMMLGIIGLLILLVAHFYYKKGRLNVEKIYTFAFSSGWIIAILAMTTKPHWLHLNLPSGRIANYFSFSAIITASFGLCWIFNQIKKNKFPLPSKLIIGFYFILIAFIFGNGFFDNSESFETRSEFSKANQMFHASEYLYQKTSNEDILLKDHNYLQNDTWMKLFLMRDYSFPLSRSYFKRYNDPTKPREMCTLWMISEPISERSQKCYNETNTNFITINPAFDSIQFDKTNQFERIYDSGDVTTYHRKTY